MMTRNTKATISVLGLAGGVVATFWLFDAGMRLLGPWPTFGAVLFIGIIYIWFRSREMFNDD